MSMRGY